MVIKPSSKEKRHVACVVEMMCEVTGRVAYIEG